MIRAYTLAEIDRMRAYFRSQTMTVIVDPTDGVDLWPDDFDTAPYPIDIHISAYEAEMRLRTAMMGNVDPAEITGPAATGQTQPNGD